MYRDRSARRRIKIKDTVEVTVRDKDGNIKSHHFLNRGLWHRLLVKMGLAHNSITATGMAAIADLIDGISAPASFTTLAIGTGITNDAVANTALQTEKKRKTCTPTRVTTTQTNDTCQWSTTFSVSDTTPTNDSTDAIDEVGIENGTPGTLLLHIAGSNYGTADTCNWSTGDTYTLTIKLQIKQGS